MQELLRRPFPQTKQAATEISRLLVKSGNTAEDDLLRRALARAALHKLAGESTPPPATIGDAIDAERWTRHSTSEAAQAVKERVVAEYPPGPVDAKSERVSESPPDWKVSATLRITNGLEGPVSEATFMVGPGDVTRQSEWSWMTCKPDPALEPHATRDVRCAGEPRAFNALEARNRLHTHTILTPTVWIMGDHVSAQFPTQTTGPQVDLDRVTEAKLAAVPCAEKGSCAEIAREERHEWKKKNLGTLVDTLSVVALLLSLWALTRRRTGDREAWPGAVASIGLIAFSAWMLATAMAGVRNSYLGLMGFGGMYLGAIPFLIALAGVAATLRSGRRTPLRLFAVSFSVLSGALLAGVLLAG